MKLKDLFKDYKIKKSIGNMDIRINGLENDSRNIRDGYLFIAEQGYTVDGHDYIDQAIDNGAIAVLATKEVDISDYEVTLILVEDMADALAFVVNSYYNTPSSKLHNIGITGTNGKTSTTYFLKEIFKESNKQVGILGTMGASINGKDIELNNTTPNALVLNKVISEMVNENVEYNFMEVSSHGLDLDRVKYMKFETSVFTNLSKDHLDYHKTFENYYQSKRKLFENTYGKIIINLDDSYGKRIVEELQEEKEVITYGIKENADIKAENIKYSLSGVDFKVSTPEGNINISLNIPGVFSVYNALAAVSVAYVYGIPFKTIKKGLENVKGVKGRFEVVPTNTKYSVIIDFAHTPEGLKQVLKVAREFVKGKIIIVFGAGGDRDRTKRPEMGKVASTYADYCILTSDNPRTEDPEQIIKDIEKGVVNTDTPYKMIVDRKEAIHYAIDISEPGDIVLLTGKGHEPYTILKDRVIPFDEKEIVLNYLKDRGETDAE